METSSQEIKAGDIAITVQDAQRAALIHWHLVGRSDLRAQLLADRHYSRKHPGDPQFCPPGHSIVLIIPRGAAAAALWVSHRPAPGALETPRADGFDYWDNPFFRNESGLRSSDLILEALAITCYFWRDHLPPDGFHSFVDETQVQGVKVRGEVVHGFCFFKAGFELAPERTKERHLLRWIMPLERLTSLTPLAPNWYTQNEQLPLFAAGE